MACQQMMQRSRRALIEENAHDSDWGQSTASRMLQHGACLLQGDALKQRSELADWNAVFEILEERSDGHPRAAKHPRPAPALGVAFRSRATA